MTTMDSPDHHEEREVERSSVAAQALAQLAVLSLLLVGIVFGGLIVLLDDDGSSRNPAGESFAHVLPTVATRTVGSGSEVSSLASPTPSSRTGSLLATPSTPTASASAVSTPPATATTTAVIQATVTVATPTATGAALAADVRQRVVDAEASLQSGRIEALLDYGNGAHATAEIEFQLGAVDRVPLLHLISTYVGSDGSRTIERIVVGNETWERQQDGPWTAGSPIGSIHEQLHSYLPSVASADPAVTEDGATALLAWFDALRDADVTLVADATTGVPQQMQRTPRSGGPTLTVKYVGWNTPVDVSAPADE
jgi:hypothetical protein